MAAALCVDMHCRDLKMADESDDAIRSAAWLTRHISPMRTRRTGADEAATRLSDRADPVPMNLQEATTDYDEAGLAALSSRSR